MGNQEWTIQKKRQRLGRQDTWRRQTQQKHNTETKKDEEHGPHQKPGVNPFAPEG